MRDMYEDRGVLLCGEKKVVDVGGVAGEGQEKGKGNSNHIRKLGGDER